MLALEQGTHYFEFVTVEGQIQNVFRTIMTPKTLWYERWTKKGWEGDSNLGRYFIGFDRGVISIDPPTDEFLQSLLNKPPA